MTDQPGKTWRRRSTRAAWRIARPFIIAYLVVLLVMMLLETRLVYPVPALDRGDWNPAAIKHEEVWFESADGTRLQGWLVSHPNPKRAILYCHGNGEDIAIIAERAAELSQKLQASVFIFDYRGYGHSEGSPCEAGCIADARAAREWFANRLGVPSTDIILMGRSLGTGVAVALAAEQRTPALVLECAFPAMTDVAAYQHPWLPVRWCMDNRYDSVARIKQYDGPVLQSHGTSDGLIPIAFARQLFDAIPSKSKRWIEYPGLRHNSPWPASYYEDLASFLDSETPQLARSPVTDDSVTAVDGKTD